uniref:Uncharacterized protein n=1 Tax=Brassica oleracea TaxID=3712 RepID=A0A3P6DM69_BRAOL|nr:unnamed protein product [Brassica oleracea]
MLQDSLMFSIPMCSPEVKVTVKCSSISGSIPPRIFTLTPSFGTLSTSSFLWMESRSGCSRTTRLTVWLTRRASQ